MSAYDGDWVCDQRQGTGELTYKDGSVYSGGWQGDKRHGYGFMRFAITGDEVKGAWSDDRFVEAANPESTGESAIKKTRLC